MGLVLANYQWSGIDPVPDPSAFKTRYGVISFAPEMEMLYSKINFLNGDKNYLAGKRVLNVLVGKGLLNRDKEALAVDSSAVFKLNKAFTDITRGLRHFYHRADKVIARRQGTEFIRGWRPWFNGKGLEGRKNFQTAFTWYDDRHDPQTVLGLWGEGSDGKKAAAESEELAGLWEAITESVRFAAP